MLRAIGLGSGKLLALLTIEMALVAAGFALIGGGAASWIIGQWQSSGIDLGSIVELIGSSPFPTVVYARASWTMTAIVMAAAVLISVAAAAVAVRPFTKHSPAALLEEQ